MEGKESNFRGRLEHPRGSSCNADQNTRNVLNKRHAQKKMRHQVRLSLVTTSESPDHDGFSWSKYGKTKIPGAKHRPRVYYRCTHRHSQGCLATKQVQRADEDPTLFDIIYHGEHTCVQSPAAAVACQPERNSDANSLLHSLTTADLMVKMKGLPALAAAHPQGWSATAPSSSTPASGYVAMGERSPLSLPPDSYPITRSESDIAWMKFICDSP